MISAISTTLFYLIFKVNSSLISYKSTVYYGIMEADKAKFLYSLDLVEVRPHIVF